MLREDAKALLSHLRRDAATARKVECTNREWEMEASPKWLHSFKAAHYIVSWKIDKFGTSKTIEDRKILEETSETLINNVKSKVILYEPTRKFDPQVKASLFEPDNVYVELSRSGTLTS
ncbi:hypothetical protein PV326_003563, partial [Microctonus aethiopoides]